MNENIFQYLDYCLNENKLSHAFLIETNNIEVLENEITEFLFKNKLIKNSVASNNLNLIIIEPEGKEIKSASIDNLKIRYASKPTNDNYNIYIIKYAEKLNISAANKLLKFLEEPADCIISFLLSSKSGQVLPTIQSRCQQFKYIYHQEEKNQDIIIDFFDYLKNPTYEKQQEIRKSIVAIERVEFIEILKEIILATEKCLNNYNSNISINILLLDKILHLLKSNVNIELVLDKLFIEVR